MAVVEAVDSRSEVDSYLSFGFDPYSSSAVDSSFFLAHSLLQKPDFSRT